VRIAQLVSAGMAVIGLVWLVLIGLLSFLQMDVGSPHLFGLPLPALLLVLGLLLGGALTLGGRILARQGAQRRRMAVASQMRDAVQDVAWTHVVAPVAEVLVDHKTVRESLLSAL